MAKLASKNSQVLVELNYSSTDGKIKVFHLPMFMTVRDWTLNCDRNTIDVSTIGTEWKESLTGQINASGSFSMLLDPAGTLADEETKKMLLTGGGIKFHIRPEGSVVGKKEYILSALVTGYDISAATEDAITIAVNFQGTGKLEEKNIDTAERVIYTPIEEDDGGDNDG